MYRNELPLEPRHLVEPSGATKTISEPMVRLVQTMHLSCTDANTTSKQKEERLMGQGVVPDLLVSVDKLDLGWIRRWLSDYNDHKVVAP